VAANVLMSVWIKLLQYTQFQPAVYMWRLIVRMKHFGYINLQMSVRYMLLVV